MLTVDERTQIANFKEDLFKLIDKYLKEGMESIIISTNLFYASDPASLLLRQRNVEKENGE